MAVDVERAQPPEFEPGPSSADALNKLKVGWLFCKERDSNAVDIDGVEVVITKTYEITVPGRRFRLTGSCTGKSETAGAISLRLHIAGGQINRVNDETVGAGKSDILRVDRDFDAEPDTYTFELILGRAGDATNIVNGAADGPDGEQGVMQLKLDDIGPAAG